MFLYCINECFGHVNATFGYVKVMFGHLKYAMVNAKVCKVNAKFGKVSAKFGRAKEMLRWHKAKLSYFSKQKFLPKHFSTKIFEQLDIIQVIWLSDMYYSCQRLMSNDCQ